MHLILEKIYGWSIGHVDASLQTMTRQFEISRSSVYDFIMQDICDKFNCFAVFDTIDNTINLYAESPIAKFIGNGEDKEFHVSNILGEVVFTWEEYYKFSNFVRSPMGVIIFILGGFVIVEGLSILDKVVLKKVEEN